MGSVRVAIIGVGNCASALVQGVEYYRHAPEDGFVSGLMRPRLGDYHVGDIEFSAAFDIDARKVDLDLSDAIATAPNNTVRFAQVPRLGVPGLPRRVGAFGGSDSPCHNLFARDPEDSISGAQLASPAPDSAVTEETRLT